MTRTPKARRVVAITLAAALLVVAGVAAWWFANRKPPPAGPDYGDPAAGFALDLRTDRLPDPVPLTDRDATRAVTRFGLRLIAVGEDGARAVLTLEEETLDFNDFGDATATASKPPTTLPVILKKSDAWYSRSEGMLYDVVAEDGRFADRLRFLRTPDPGVAHTLIVRPADGGEDMNPERILELRDPAGAPITGGPMPDQFHFTTLIRNDYSGGSGRWARGVIHEGVRVRGSVAEGKLYLDPNRLRLYATGRIAETTLLGYTPFLVAFRELGPDPAKKGRRAFVLVPGTEDVLERLVRTNAPPNGPRAYVLVLAADRLGPHRLVVKQGGEVRQVLALAHHDPQLPSPHPAMLATLSEPERAAVVRLRYRYGDNARFYANDGRVWYVVLLNADDDALADLREFKGLRYLVVWGERITDDGLRTLGSLTQLKELTVRAYRATDAGLAHLEPLQGLRYLDVYPRPVSQGAIDALRAKLSHLQTWSRPLFP